MHRAWKDYVLPYKLIEKMERLKAQGKIRFMGFSFHDNLQLFKKVVEYTPAWDFCLIQHNYLDYEYEAGVLGPKYAAANGMGLAVMKPVRTGFLANLPQVMRDALASTGIHKPDAEWALDYLWDIPEVSVAVQRHGQYGGRGGEPEVCRQSPPPTCLPLPSARHWGRPSTPTATLWDISTATRAATSASPVRTMSPLVTSSPTSITTTSLHRNKERAMADYTVSMSPVQRGDPAILVRRLRRVPGEVPAASGHSRSAGEGEGDDGEIILAPLPDFPYLRNHQLCGA